MYCISICVHLIDIALFTWGLCDYDTLILAIRNLSLHNLGHSYILNTYKLYLKIYLKKTAVDKISTWCLLF